MIVSFAWKNLWRNKLRSSVLIGAVTLGLFAAIFLTAFTNGMVNDRIQAIIRTEMAHIQIHKPGFTDNSQFLLFMNNADSIMTLIKNTPHVKAVSKRIIVNSMIASAEAGIGVKITGIDPQDEKNVTDIDQKIIKGKYLDETGKNPVVISDRLAEKLKVGLKNKIVITVQDINKNLTSGLFRIAGIYRTDNMMYDETNIFVRNSDIGRLTGLLKNQAHEIAILLDNNENTDKTTKILTSDFPKLEVKNWQQLSPEAGYLVSVMNQYLYIFIIIILLALSFGIVNTMLMSIMERIKELGMLMAIGMNNLKIFVMIMFETIFVSLTGGILGIIIGFVISKYFEKSGINLYFWKEAFAEIGYSSFVYPFIDIKTLFVTAILVVAAAIVSALYPAYKALKLNPSEAIRAQ